MQPVSSLFCFNIVSPAVGFAAATVAAPPFPEKAPPVMRRILSGVIVMLLLIFVREVCVGARNPAADEDVQTFQVYPTEQGDTLRSIAGRKEILRDPLKWILLYRLNRDELARFKVSSVRLADVPLPAGLNIIYINPEEARKQAVGKIAGRAWVVHLFSDNKVGRVESLAVRLVAKGYNAYIIRPESKQPRRYDLRAGFFADRDQAAEAGRRMIRLLGLPQYRAMRASVKETKEFIGYTD